MPDDVMEAGDRLTRLLAALPVGRQVRIEVEVAEETGERMLVACLYEQCPDGGWPDRAAYFGHDPAPEWERRVVDFPEKFADSVLWGFGVPAADSGRFVEGLIVALEADGRHGPDREAAPDA